MGRGTVIRIIRRCRDFNCLGGHERERRSNRRCWGDSRPTAAPKQDEAAEVLGIDLELRGRTLANSQKDRYLIGTERESRIVCCERGETVGKGGMGG